MSAMPPIATKAVSHIETSLCANSDLTRCSKKGQLLDHLVGLLQERLRDCEAERFHGLEVHDQLELG
jgi:hypothetical protein